MFRNGSEEVFFRVARIPRYKCKICGFLSDQKVAVKMKEKDTDLVISDMFPGFAQCTESENCLVKCSAAWLSRNISARHFQNLGKTHLTDLVLIPGCCLITQLYALYPDLNLHPCIYVCILSHQVNNPASLETSIQNPYCT